MNHSMKISIASLTTMFAVVACSAEVPDADTAAVYSAELAVSPEMPSSSSALLDEDSSERVGTAVQALKVCTVTCTMTSVAASAECSGTVYGYGTAGFLGGYPRACRRARGDAKANLPPGCALGSCSEAHD